MEPILIKDHKKDCIARKEYPWSFLPCKENYTHEVLENTKRYKGSKSSRPHINGRYIWYQVICNDPGCPAQVRIPEFWILDQVENFLRRESDG